MYAVFEDRRQQFRVTAGDRILMPLNVALEPGSSVTFDKVCAVGGEQPRIGAPYVDGVSVTAKVLGSVKGEKVVIQKFRRRKDSRSKTGFRARFTQVQIESIDGC
ncbi:MAG: 50S ribosomal protein L21 [Planctomycetota bacterium]